MKLTKAKPKTLVLVGIAVGAILLAYVLSYTAVMVNLELNSLDLRFSLRGAMEIEDNPVVIVAIDDQSDESTPDRWPWPRAYYAHVIENLQEAGATVIGLDVMLDQSDVSNLKSDNTLAAVLNKYDNVVLTGKLTRTSQHFSYDALHPPFEKFRQGKASWGLAALEADPDGFYRRYPVGQVYNDSLMPSFAAEILRRTQSAGENRDFWIDKDYFHLGPYQIKKFDPSSMLINYIGPAFSFPYYSFDSILDDVDFNLREEFDLNSFDDPGDSTLGIPSGIKYSDVFKDKIVLIGSSMHELHDNFPTPFLEHRNRSGDKVLVEMPGVEIHANAILTILSGQYLSQLSAGWTLLILILLAGLIYFGNRYLSTIASAISSSVLLILYLIAVSFAFIQSNLILPFASPILTILFSYAGYTVYSYLLTQHEKKMLRGAFAHYVPETVIQDIMNNPEKLKLGGEERIVTVMFSDVAGFTTISESLKPRELVKLLNEYLTSMTDIVLKHRGVIDKYEGDAIMAEFGVPVGYKEHAITACSAALEMQNELKLMRKEWAKLNMPELQARIGINTGEVIVGNMGSRDVFDYTVMGDHVNLGSRLEGANKLYGTRIMISEYTYALVKDDFLTRPLDFIRVKGKKKPIEVFELVSSLDTKFSDDFHKYLELYARGIAAYRNQKWMDAADIFEYCLKIFPEDQVSTLYHKRCYAYKLDPPDENWDGVTTMTEK